MMIAPKRRPPRLGVAEHLIAQLANLRQRFEIAVRQGFDAAAVDPSLHQQQ
jgi:hypothetical protein